MWYFVSVTLSESTCLASTFYTVDSVSTQEFYVDWSRDFYKESPLVSTCRVNFDPRESRSKICVEVESYNIQDCGIQVNYVVNEGGTEITQVFDHISNFLSGEYFYKVTV